MQLVSSFIFGAELAVLSARIGQNGIYEKIQP